MKNSNASSFGNFWTKRWKILMFNRNTIYSPLRVPTNFYTYYTHLLPTFLYKNLLYHNFKMLKNRMNTNKQNVAQSKLISRSSVAILYSRRWTMVLRNVKSCISILKHFGGFQCHLPHPISFPRAPSAPGWPSWPGPPGAPCSPGLPSGPRRPERPGNPTRPARPSGPFTP